MGRALTLLAISFVIAACAGSPPVSQPRWTFAPDESPAITTAVEVYKSATCSCCHEWEAYLRSSGYTVRSVATDDLGAVKESHAVPRHAWSCHTALIAGYVVEGHVPVEAIADLLEKRPSIDGIALPGMPAGSPGMPGQKEAPFEILAIADGQASAFGAY